MAIHVGGAPLSIGLPIFGPRVAIMGDSIWANTHLQGSSTISAKLAIGGLTHWAMMCGQRIELPPACNLAASGTATAQITADSNIAALLALSPRPDFVVIGGPTNDLSTSGNPAAHSTLVTGYTKLINAALGAGIQPIMVPILPRNSLTTNSLRGQARFNTWLREICLSRSDLVSAAGLPLRGRPILVDPTEHLIDQATGGIKSGYTTDAATHPNVKGAYWIGYEFHQVITPLLPNRKTKPLAFGDIYDATWNPSGNLLFTGTTNKGLFPGTGGAVSTANGVTPTGSVGTGWTLLRNTGSSTATLVGSKENPRTDLPNSNGERQVVVVTVTGAGLAEEWNVLYGSGLNVVAGDQIFAEVAFEIVNTGVNIGGVDLYLQESGTGTAGATPQITYDGAYLSAAGYGTLPDGIAYSGVLRTPPITCSSGANQFVVEPRVIVKGDTGSASATVKFGDAAVRKVV